MALNFTFFTKIEHYIYEMDDWRHEKSLFLLRNLYVLGMSALMQSLANLGPTWTNFHPTWGMLGPNLD